jgi:methionyl-tRNA formyltransferase
MGSPDFTIDVLKKLMLNGQDIAAVYTKPDKPAGRGRESLPPPIKTAAIALGLPVVQVVSFKEPQAVEQLESFKPQAIVVAAYGQLLPQSVLDITKYGCLNIHPSLLPEFRGPSPVVSAILSGKEFAGVSVMRLDAGMDSGPVFCRSQVPILEEDTSASLTPRLFNIGAGMLLEVLAQLAGGKIEPLPQDHGLATITREIEKADGLIDWNQPAIKIWRQVRAYQPWPEAFTFWQGKQLKIKEAVPMKVGDALEPGRVALIPSMPPGVGFVVGSGEGALGIKTLQIEGKKAMSALEFLRGQKDFIGAKLG